MTVFDADFMGKVRILIVHRYTVKDFFLLSSPILSASRLQSGKVFDRATSRCHPYVFPVVVLFSRRMQIDRVRRESRLYIHSIPALFPNCRHGRRDKSRASRRYCTYLNGPHLERKAYLRRRQTREWTFIYYIRTG